MRENRIYALLPPRCGICLSCELARRSKTESNESLRVPSCAILLYVVSDTRINFVDIFNDYLQRKLYNPETITTIQRPMPKKTQRLGILSLHERELIKVVDEIRSGKRQNKGRAPSRLAQLLPDLDKRISALDVDLATLLKSKALKPFLKSRMKDLNLSIARHQQIQNPEFDYDYSTWQVKKYVKEGERTRRYWLDISESNAPKTLTIENIFGPEYAIRGIDGYSVTTSEGKSNVRDILVSAVEFDMKMASKSDKKNRILPLSQGEAVTINDLIQRMYLMQNKSHWDQQVKKATKNELK